MILFGHRGAKGEAPENTVAGFTYARTLGITAFELDVRLSADDHLVVMHDATVDRTTNGSGPISAAAAAELAGLDARAEHPGWPSRIGVPKLAEVFAAVRDAAQWEVEIKTDAPPRLERICALLSPMINRFSLQERVTVSSFDPIALELIANIAPDLPRCFIGAYDTPDDIETARRLGCTRAAVPLRTGSAAIVQAAHAAGLEVTGWPGNTADGVRTLLGWGVDNITTDYPTMAMATVQDVSSG